LTLSGLKFALLLQIPAREVDISKPNHGPYDPNHASYYQNENLHGVFSIRCILGVDVIDQFTPAPLPEKHGDYESKDKTKGGY